MEDIVLQNVIILIQKKCNGNVSAFSKAIGIPATTINGYVTRKRSLSLSFILAILNAFENISAEWLLRNNGSELISERREVETPIMTNAEFINAMQTLNSLSSKVQELYEENQKLKEQLKDKPFVSISL